MPNWRKLIVSGSDAHLNSLDVNTFISASEFVGGDFIGDGSQLTNVSASYLSNELTASISGSITAFSSSISGRVELLEVTGSDHESRLDTLEGKTLVSSSAQTDRTWIVGANGFSDYTFSGSGLIGTENDPTLYLTRGEVYRFDIQSGGSHPFRIQSTPNGSAGTQYNDGLSGNDLTSGTLIWNVQFDSPSILYYQCVNHGSMGGVIHILDKLPEGTLSGSAQIAEDISGSFTSLSSSFEQRITSNEDNIATLTSVTSSYALEANISGAFTDLSSSFEQRITSNESSISSLNSATSSYLLNTTDTLDGDLTVTGKITAQEFHTEFVSASIIYQSGSTKFGDTSDDVHSFTGSVNISGSISADNLVGILSSSAQIADEISGSFTDLSSSFEQRITLNEATGSDQEIRLDTAEGSISSLNAATSSYALQADISGAFDNVSSSFEQRITLNESTGSDHEIRIDSLEGSVSSLNSATSSYALEANISGAFVSVSQSIAGDIEDIIDGTTIVTSASYALTASYAENVPETASYALNSLSSSYAVTASYALNAGAGLGFPFSGSAVITGSLYVSQSTISGSFVGDGSGIEGVVSSSYAFTASYALNAGGADTGSLLTTASAAGSTITFEKGDGSTFDVIVSSEVTPANAVVTASLDGSTLTFEKGDTSTFNITLPAGGYSGSNATAHLNQTIAAATWSFAHNLDDRYPVFTIFDSNGDIIVPNRVETVDTNNANIYFTTARTGTATAVIASSISQIASVTANFTNETTVAVTHSLDTRNIHVSVYDTNYSLVVPESITLDTLDTVVVTFPTAQSGTVVVAQGGHIISGSAATATSASYAEYATTSSYAVDFEVANSFTASGLIYPTTDGTFGVEVVQTDALGNLSLEIPKTIYETVKNVSGVTLLKGTPVHTTGSGTSGNSVGVVLADASDPSLMPATYILDQDLTDEEEGLGIAIGFINGVDTTGLEEGAPVYVAVGGGWTQTKPTGSALIQNLGIVTRVDVNGSGVVLGAGRSNDVPNILQGYAWVGNADQVATATPTASFFVTSGSHALNADDAISASYAANADLLDGLNSSQFLRNDQSGTVTGDLTVTGTLTAQEFHTEFVSASIIYQSGSTKFGNSADDIHSFTGSIQVLGDVTGSINPTGHLLPSQTNTYDLGSPSQQWRDLYLSSASLYVDGVKVLSSDANVLTFTTDTGQSIKILEDGSDDITLQTENGNIELKGTVEITSGKKIIDSAGTVIQFGDSLGITGSIVASGTVNGIDLQAFSSSLEQRTSGLELFSSSLDATFATDADLNLVSASVDALNAATSSYALETNISGAFASVSSSIATDISNIVDGTTQVPSASLAQTASYIDPTFISASAAASGFGAGGGGGTGDGFPYEGDAVITGSLFVSGGLISGSFAGDGSQLTGIDVGAVASVSDTFTSQTQVVVTHNFNSKDVNVAVYNNSDQYIIPDNITLTDFNTVTVDFAVPTSGRIVVSKGGHIISGIGLNTKAGTVLTSSFAATGSSFYYDVVFDAPFASAEYTVGLQAHSQFSVPDSFPGHAWVDSDKATTGFRIVVPSFDTTMDEISWTAVAHGESNVTASYALSALTASYALNAGAGAGFPYSGSAEITGSFVVSGSFVDFTNATVISGSIFSGSFVGDGTGLTGLGYGDTKKLNQTVAATTWSFNHNMNEQYPTVTVYNSNNEVVQPSKIEAVSTSTLNLYFGIPTAGTAVAVVGGVATTQEAGFNRVLEQTIAATTWSFAHNLGQKYPQFEVYDSNDELIIPGKVQAVDQNNAILYFDTPQAGTVAATVGGTAMTASYADTLVVTDTLLSSQKNTDVDTGIETVATVSTTFYDGAFFDYVLKDGTNYRAGTVTAVWDGTSVQYSEISTPDIGNTNSVTMSVDISGTDARLRASVGSDNWNIKAFVRAL